MQVKARAKTMMSKYIHMSQKQFEILKKRIEGIDELCSVLSEMENTFSDNPIEIEYQVVSQHNQ